MATERSIEDGQEAAKLCAINALSVLKTYLGDLGKVKNIIKLLIFVNSADGFTQQPAVGNGASQFFVDIFGEAGQHARSAIGVSELPFDVTVEIELIVEI